jgi:hypothetical protein
MNIKELLGVLETENNKLNPVSDKQWATYLKMCSQKFVQPRNREDFDEFSMKTELQRLYNLPFARKASDAQIKAFKEACQTLGLKVPSDEMLNTLSNVDISNRLQFLGTKLPITEGQANMIENIYRFGLCTQEDIIALDKNKTAASEFISKYSDELAIVSADKATLNQIKRIIELEKKLHNKTFTITDFTDLTFEKASTWVGTLKQEDEDRKEAYLLGWDMAGVRFNFDEDTSRSVEKEEENSLSLADRNLKDKITILRKLQYIVNVGGDPVDDIDDTTVDELNATELDKNIVELYQIATAIGEGQAAYNVLTAAKEKENSGVVKPEPAITVIPEENTPQIVKKSRVAKKA